MCILLAAYQDHPDYDLIIAANRDEFHDRPAAPAAAWHDAPHVMAGRDLEAGGTWLGIASDGRFAAVTNLRRAGVTTGRRSRGMLVADFLTQRPTAASYSEVLLKNPNTYAGVNLLYADADSLRCWSNQDNLARELPAGVYGVSNAHFDCEWPKLTRLKAAYLQTRSLAGEQLITALFAILRDDAPAADALLPDTGIGLAMERKLSPIFITAGAYGTRCSSVVLRERSGGLHFVERRFDVSGSACGESHYRSSATEPTFRRSADVC